MFVPLDTTAFTKYYRDVMAKGVINRYSIRYVDGHRKEIAGKYRTDTDYVKGFEVDSAMLADLYAMAEKDGVKPDSGQQKQSKPIFKMILKALIGRDIYDNATYFKVYNTFDPIFRKAFEIINSDEYDRILSTGSGS